MIVLLHFVAGGDVCPGVSIVEKGPSSQPLSASAYAGPEADIWGFPGGSDGKESACNAGDWGLIPGLGISPGEGNGYSLQYSCISITVNEVHKNIN